MAELQNCSDISDIKPLYLKRQLYLKPLLKINISIQLPSLKLVGRSISNVTLIENIKAWASPDKFCSVKVTKSTLEFIRFEADLLNPSKVHAILARLDGKQVTLPGFKEIVKVRASPAKSDFPTRHDWDSFFRDAKHMNEMKAGERPDTLYLSDLPNKWFSTKSKEDLPSESLLKKLFQQFGEVTAVDIPSVDPYRSKMKAHLSGLKLFNFNQNTTFESYVQFRDYISFVKAMDYLRGMKLLKIENDKTFTTNIKVDFDKTKHLSENSIRKRKIEREKLMNKDRELEEKKQKLEDALKLLENKEKEEKKVTEKKEKKAKLESKKKKAEKRKSKELLNNCPDQSEISLNILKEKKLLLVAQRKLESIRILTELFRIIKDHKRKNIMDIGSNANVISEKPTMDEAVEKNLKTEESSIAINHTSQTEKFNSTEERHRLNSEVVKVLREPSDHGAAHNEAQTRYFNNNRQSSRRWQQRWSSVNGSKRLMTTKWQHISQNNEYFRNTHQLYYKYFQSITRNNVTKSDKTNIRDRSRSHSKSRSNDSTILESSRSRSSINCSPKLTKSGRKSRS